MPVTKIYFNVKEVCEMLSVSKATLYRMIAGDHFPAPTKLGLRRSGWHVDRVQNYIDCMERWQHIST
jgi:excisionase family DNA binding protein